MIARLPGQLRRIDAVREHQEADGLHPEIARRGEVLDRRVRLGAMGGDPGHRRAALMGVLEVMDRADSGQQKHRDTSLFGLFDGAAYQRELVRAGEAVVEAGAAEAVAVRRPR